MIKAVIFDLDGTLLNTLEDLADAVNHTMHVFGFQEHNLEQVRKMVGNGVGVLMKRALPENTEEQVYHQCLAEFKQYYAAHMQDKTKPYAGIEDMLSALKEKGIKMAIVSNKFDVAVKALNGQYFGTLIEVAIGESAKVKRKPAPDCVYAALEELSVSKSEALYVGDSDVDVETAHNAGMRCVGVTWGFRDYELLKKTGADDIIDIPEQLLSVINKLGESDGK